MATRRSSTINGLEQLTHNALDAAVHLQNAREPKHEHSKARRLSYMAFQLELAVIENRPERIVHRMCLEVAAMSLRLLEQGDAPKGRRIESRGEPEGDGDGDQSA